MTKRNIFIVSLCIAILLASTAYASYYDEGKEGISEADAYIIDSLEDLEELSSRVNSGAEPSGRYYKLTSSLKISGGATWNPIGAEPHAFTGHFDGSGETITMNITNEAYRASLFGLIGTPENYAVKNLNVNGTINGKFTASIASVIDYNTDASIENCTFTGNLNSEYQYNSTDSPTDNHTSAGGIVEVIQSGTIRNCKVLSASIKSNQNQSQSNISAYAGGIAATMGGGRIVSCEVTGSEISAYGEDSYTGGIIGNSNYGVVMSCNFTGELDSAGYSGGIVGKMENLASDVKSTDILINNANISLTSSDMIGMKACSAFIGQLKNSAGSLILNKADVKLNAVGLTSDEVQPLLNMLLRGIGESLNPFSLASVDNTVHIDVRVSGKVEHKVGSGGCNLGFGLSILAGVFIFLRRK